MKVQLLSWPRTVIAMLCLALALGYGCSSSNSSTSLSASFTESGTASTPNLVKLVQASASNAQVVVQAMIYGPTTSTDIYSFAFDVAIGDPTIVRFVSGSAVGGDALVAGTGQTIIAEGDPDGSDPSTVVVGVSKAGGGVGSGNGVTGASAVVVRLTFQVLKAGTTTLTFSGSPTPQALDSAGVPIASVTFDAASASMTGISTSSGGY